MGSYRDPTANAAIGNVMKEQKARRRVAGPYTRWPDLFNGLMHHEARELVMRAWEISGRGSIEAIERDHVEKARAERDLG